jgi:hypothetical protein
VIYNQKRIDRLSDSGRTNTAAVPGIIATSNTKSPILQGNQASNITVNTDYSVKSSPPVNQAATTIVQSFGQQGGITAQNVAITITNGDATFQAVVLFSNDFVTQQKAGKFETQGTFRLISPFTVGALTVFATGGESITFEDMESGSMIGEIQGTVPGAAYQTIHNAAPGLYRFTATSSGQMKFGAAIK